MFRVSGADEAGTCHVRFLSCITFCRIRGFQPHVRTPQGKLNLFRIYMLQQWALRVSNPRPPGCKNVNFKAEKSPKPLGIPKSLRVSGPVCKRLQTGPETRRLFGIPKGDRKS